MKTLQWLEKCFSEEICFNLEIIKFQIAGNRIRDLSLESECTTNFRRLSKSPGNQCRKFGFRKQVFWVKNVKAKRSDDPDNGDPEIIRDNPVPSKLDYNGRGHGTLALHIDIKYQSATLCIELNGAWQSETGSVERDGCMGVCWSDK